MAVYFSKSRGSWYIRVSYNGRQFYCYRSSDGVFASRKSAASYEPAFVAGLVDAPAAPGLCDDYFVSFVTSLGGSVKDSTVYGFSKVFDKYVAPVFRGVSVSDVDDGFLDFANRKVNRSFKGKDPQRVFSVCRHWATFLNRQGLRLDPMRFYPMGSRVRDSHIYKVWDLATFEAFLSCEKDASWVLLFSVLYYYGLRIGEALGLQWRDFTKRGLRIARMVSVKNLSKTMEVTSPKTRSSAAVLPVVQAVYRLVPSGSDPNSFCFVGRDGVKPFGQTTVVHRIQAVSKRAGLKPLTPHEFRHSCASYLLSQGMPLREVSKWLRHSSEVVTASVYAHLFPGELADVGKFWDGKLVQNTTEICGKSVVQKNKKT